MVKESDTENRAVFFVFFSVPLKQLNMQTKNSSFLFSQIKMEDNEIFKNSNK